MIDRNKEFLPALELETFIVEGVIRPVIEDILNKGIRLEAELVFIAGKQRKVISKIGTVSRSISTTITVHCVNTSHGAVKFSCECSPTELTAHTPKEASWIINAEIRSDNKGFYCNCRDFDYIEI